jgi:sulfite reductase alpha subunit-like flavoprotein
VCGDAKHMAAAVRLLSLRACPSPVLSASSHLTPLALTCGCAWCALQVLAAWQDIAGSAGGLNKAASVEYIAQLKKQGRYLQDIW